MGGDNKGPREKEKRRKRNGRRKSETSEQL